MKNGRKPGEQERKAIYLNFQDRAGSARCSSGAGALGRCAGFLRPGSRDASACGRGKVVRDYGCMGPDDLR
jgi:hypothetical protein